VNKHEVLVKAVTIQGLSYGQVAPRFGVPKSLVHKLHHRWLIEGDAALDGTITQTEELTDPNPK
jgi:transposase